MAWSGLRTELGSHCDTAISTLQPGTGGVSRRRGGARLGRPGHRVVVTIRGNASNVVVFITVFIVVIIVLIDVVNSYEVVVILVVVVELVVVEVSCDCDTLACTWV